jgi:hypothetical protein
LTLLGNASVAEYQAALRTVQYQNTNAVNPSTLVRSVRFKVNDGVATSNLLTRSIQVTVINQSPVLANLEVPDVLFTEAQPPTPVTFTIEVTDGDDANLQSATVEISANFVSGQDQLLFVDAPPITGNFTGNVLTLSGNASLALYQAALRTVQYFNLDPFNPSTLVRTLRFTVSDGQALSNALTRDIQVIAVNTPPLLSTFEAPLVYAGPTVLTSLLTVLDIDNANLVGASVVIADNFVAAEDQLVFVDVPPITGNFAAGVLTLTGNASLAAYQAALRTVQYQNNGGANPTEGTRTFNFTVNDGVAVSNVLTRQVQVPATNLQPLLAAIEVPPLIYTASNVSLNLTSSVTVSDPENGNLASATVEITNNFVAGEDFLSLPTPPAGLTAVFNGALTITGAAPSGVYQTALRSVQYRNNNTVNPSALPRTVSLKVNDGALESNVVTRNIEISAVTSDELVTIDIAALNGRNVFNADDEVILLRGQLHGNDSVTLDGIDISVGSLSGGLPIPATAFRIFHLYASDDAVFSKTEDTLLGSRAGNTDVDATA